MLKQLFCVVCFIFYFTVINARYPNYYPKIQEEYITEGPDPGPPLFLTPLIKSGKIQEAQNASKATFNGFKNITSYSGYLTVNQLYNSNLFFWFFPALNNYADAPVILWLQGGPGASSLFGLFTENGPYSVKNKKGLKLRKYTWITQHSVIYIDNPVGTGFSFTKNTKGYAKSQTDVGKDLYEALIQFFQLFPELQNNPFYVSGESYGGKYAPAISYTIYQKNQKAKQKINLQGLTIGNGLSDPINQLNYGEYLYQIGLIDTNTLATFKNVQAQTKKFIQAKQWLQAFNSFDGLLNGDKINGSTIFHNETGFSLYFNYLHDKSYINEENMGKYIQRNDIRAAIHVGGQPFNDGTVVENYLLEDVMQSVAPWISTLLSNYRVLIYNGQLDIIVAYPLTVNYLQNLQFSGANEYKTAPRQKWYVGAELARDTTRCSPVVSDWSYVRNPAFMLFTFAHVVYIRTRKTVW